MLSSKCGDETDATFVSARVVQVIQWFSIMNQDRSHEEGVVLMQIEYPNY